MGRREYFCGWYFKCRSETDSVALIPAVHWCGGKKSASIQIITDEKSWNFPLAGDQARIWRYKPYAALGGSRFSADNVLLHVSSGSGFAMGSLTFCSHTPLSYDIMGPFACFPFLECRHSVFSMRSTVSGNLQIGGKTYVFRDGTAYIEGDGGRSFPERYLWTQCDFSGGSLMLAVAEIPLPGLRFTGVTGAVLLDGREYRLATYLGAKVSVLGGGKVTIRQGKLMLTARLLGAHPHPLHAPLGGAMTRTVRENLVCRARYSLQKGENVLLDFESGSASFEWEYP